LLAFGGALEQPGQMAPRELRAVFGRQMLFDQRAHVCERLKRQQIGDGQRPRPIGSGQGLILRNTKVFPD
jgi:hypothetical protein